MFLTIGANLVLPADSSYPNTIEDLLPAAVTWFSIPVVIAGGIIGACGFVLGSIHGQLKTAGRAALGVAVILLVLLVWWPPPTGEHVAALDSLAIAQLRTINTQEVVYAQFSGGRFASIADLIKAGLLDERVGWNPSGYSFDVIADQAGYTAAATPVASNSPRAKYGYYSTSDGVVRYSTDPLLAPKDRSGSPVE
jgi:hypothetical protein